MALTPAQTQYVFSVAQALLQAEVCKGERAGIVRRAAEMLGCSVNTVYRHLQTVAGWRSGRKPRTDKGETCVTEELARKASGMVHMATRANGKKTMSLKLSRNILENNGFGVVNPETGEVTMPSVETLSRAAKQYNCHPDQLKKGKPTGHMRSLHPNHCWQIDASVCVLYYLPGSKRVGMMDERHYNAKKPGKLIEIRNNRVVRYVVTDHTTNAFVVRYEQAPGEDAKGVIDTLIMSMCDRGPHDPMHGVPFILYMDPGSGNKSSLVMEFCARLDIRPIHHATGAANATGSVENCQNIVETQFESRQRFQGVPDLAFLQEQVDAWRRHYNAKEVHSRHKMTRSAAWTTIENDQLRTVERDVLEAVAYWKDETRTVGDDFTITVDTRTHFGVCRYDLRELGHHGLGSKAKVRVRLNPYKAPTVTVILEQPDGSQNLFDVPPMQTDRYGQDVTAAVIGESFKSLPDTQTDRQLKAIHMDAYQVGTTEEAEKAAKQRKTPYANINPMADVREAPLFLRQKGNSVGAGLNLPTAEPAPMSRVAFATWMMREHPETWNERTTAACMDWLRERYPDQVPGGKLANVAEKLCDRFGPKQAVILTMPTATDQQRSAACAG